MLIYGDTLESQGFSFFTEVKISTTIKDRVTVGADCIFLDNDGVVLNYKNRGTTNDVPASVTHHMNVRWYKYKDVPLPPFKLLQYGDKGIFRESDAGL